MSNRDLVFRETAVNYMMDDIACAVAKIREGSAEMSDLVEHELVEWTDTSEARQAQQACAQRSVWMRELKTWRPPWMR